MDVVAEKSTSAQLKSIAQEIRGCRHELSLPEEHARYIVELVERSLAVPDAFSELDCLRGEIGRLKYNYPADWQLRAIQAIARAFAPGFKPSSSFMEGGWFTGGWDDVEKIADAVELEANRKAEDKTDNLTSEMMSLSQAARVFAFGTPKELIGFLDRHPKVNQGRPLTKTGKPHPRRRTVDVLDLVRAISRDDAIMSDPARIATMKARLERAEMAKELEDSALAMFGVKTM